MLLIGDIHGDIVKYQRLIKQARSSIQVGDLGLGFPDQYGARMTNLFRRMDERPSFHEHHKVLRGNHDNPGVFCGHEIVDDFGKTIKTLPLRSYLGDWGYLPDQVWQYLSCSNSIAKQYIVTQQASMRVRHRTGIALYNGNTTCRLAPDNGYSKVMRSDPKLAA